MRTSRVFVFALCIVLNGACNGGNDEFETRNDNIVRATSNGGRNEVVMVFGVVGADASMGG